MTPELRCTIFHDTFAPDGIVVDQPLGLKDAKLKLEREPTYSSLVETFEGEFIWYGSARTLLRQIEDADGPNAKVGIHFDIRYKKVFEPLFHGLFNMEELQDIDNPGGGHPYKCTVPIVRDDLWARMINQRSKPVNLQSPNDIYGETREVLTPTTLSLPTQKIQQKFFGRTTSAAPELWLLQQNLPAGQAMAFDLFNEVTIDEIKERISVGTDMVNPPVGHMFKLAFAGSYRFNISMYVWGLSTTYQVSPDVNAWIQFNEGAPVALTRTDIGTDFVDGVTLFELVDYDVDLIAGTIVRIFLRNDNGFAVAKPVTIPNNNPIIHDFDSVLDIVAGTIYPDSTSPAFPVHEAFQSVLDRITGRDKAFYSEHLGNPSTQQVDYPEFGCGSAYALAKGINVRGYSLLSKPFAASLDNLWTGLHPCLNLGLGYGKIAGPVLVQFLKNPLILHFDSPDNLDWINEGNPLYNDWTENGDGFVGATVGVGGFTKYLRQQFPTKPAGTDYVVHLEFVTAGAGQEVRVILETWLDGVLQETIYDANEVSIAPTNNVVEVAFTAALPYNMIKLSIEGIDPAPHPTAIDFVVKLFQDFISVVDAPVIRVEERRFFYNPTPSLLLSNCKLVRTYDSNEITKSIKIGYAKSLVGSASGIDDPQTSRTYGTQFATIGKDQNITSTLVAASLAIEETRRQARLEPGKDWQLDNDIMIIALNKDTLTEPELDENFSSVLNLLNKETRYNIRLSVARNMQRWLSVFTGCLQWFSGTAKYLKFLTGTGNFDMQTNMDGADCEGDDLYLSESQDLYNGIDDFIQKPVAYEYDKAPLSWEDYKTIRDNSEHGIGMSRTEENHKVTFIKRLEYSFMDAEAKINTLLGELDPIEE